MLGIVGLILGGLLGMFEMNLFRDFSIVFLFLPDFWEVEEEKDWSDPTESFERVRTWWLAILGSFCALALDMIWFLEAKKSLGLLFCL